MAMPLRFEYAGAVYHEMVRSDGSKAIVMGKTIELPDLLFAEIDGYAHLVAATPVTVIRQAWNEFRHYHPQEPVTPPMHNSDTEDLILMVHTLRGSISLPTDVDDKTLITEARLEKYGPL
jgi:hypothetical protein